jgi:hypothetical protein
MGEDRKSSARGRNNAIGPSQTNVGRSSTSPWQIALGWIGATTAFGYRSIDPIMGGGGSRMCHIRHMLDLFLARFHLPHCRRIPTFMLPVYLKGTFSRSLPCFRLPRGEVP